MKKQHAPLLVLFILTIFFPCTSSAEYSNSNPSEACAYLDSRGMTTRGYKNPDGLGFFCSSPYKELAGSPLSNNIAYYAEGDQKTVRKLKLILNVNSKKTSKGAHSELAASADTLVRQALKAPLPPKAKEAILAGKSGSWKIGKSTLNLKREDWRTGKGYELRFSIE